MKKKINKYEIDNSLKLFAKELTLILKQNANGQDQGAQITSLMKLEESFRKNILRFGQSREVYKQFILMITVKNKHILTARPYFREKAKTFNSQITSAIKNANIKKLQEFHINYNFIKFIRESWKGPFPERAQECYSQILNLRKKIVENTMPLAINKAKLFYRKVPRNHLSLMDMVGIAANGLVSGVDKWVGNYSRVFNGVCIGRMTGNLIENYSETTLHFYPTDRNILYRANSLRFKLNIQDIEKLAEEINKSYIEDRKKGIKTPKHSVTADELSSLLNAASVFSIDSPNANSESEDYFQDYSESNSEEGQELLEETMIKSDLISKTINAARKLPILQQKVLRLKGVKL